MSKKEEIKQLIRRHLDNFVPYEFNLPPTDGEHVDYSQGAFLKLNPEWEGKPDAIYAYLEWMALVSQSHLDAALSNSNDEDIPF